MITDSSSPRFASFIDPIDHNCQAVYSWLCSRIHFLNNFSHNQHHSKINDCNRLSEKRYQQSTLLLLPFPGSSINSLKVGQPRQVARFNPFQRIQSIVATIPRTAVNKPHRHRSYQLEKSIRCNDSQGNETFSRLPIFWKSRTSGCPLLRKSRIYTFPRGANKVPRRYQSRKYVMRYVALLSSQSRTFTFARFQKSI